MGRVEEITSDDIATPVTEKVKEVKVKEGVTICWNGIYRNESAIIERALESVKPVIDYVCVIVTGTEDNTKEKIEQWCAKNEIPCHVGYAAFVNFSVSRNAALDLARKTFPQATYLLVTDADMMLEVLPGFSKDKLSADGYRVNQEHGSLVYPNVRLVKTNVKWEYRCSTHEFLSFPNGSVVLNLPTLKIRDVGDGGFKVVKAIRDRDLLLKEYADPTTAPDLIPRAAFYLANTYKDLGEFDEAIKWYKRKVYLGGFDQEVFISKMNIGLCYECLANKEKVDDVKSDLFDKAFVAFIHAWESRPSRAEALYHASELCRIRCMNSTAFTLAITGKFIPYPSDTLFIQKDVYTWRFDFIISICAFYVPGKMEVGKSSLVKILELGPSVVGQSIYDVSKSNATHYKVDVTKYK